MFTHRSAFPTHLEARMKIVKQLTLQSSLLLNCKSGLFCYFGGNQDGNRSKSSFSKKLTCTDFRRELDLPLLLLITSEDEKSWQVEFTAQFLATRLHALRCLHTGEPSHSNPPTSTALQTPQLNLRNSPGKNPPTSTALPTPHSMNGVFSLI